MTNAKFTYVYFVSARFAFVEFNTTGEVSEAIRTNEGLEIDGRVVSLQFKQKGGGGRSGGGGGRGGGGGGRGGDKRGYQDNSAVFGQGKRKPG